MEFAFTPTTLIALSAFLLLFITLTNVLFWPRLRQIGEVWPGQVSVLIPARNEAANLPACLETVLRQGATVGEILIYNDHSTDTTAEIIAEWSAKDARIQAVPVQPLAAGWCGKNFACAQLARAASGKWMLFLDADARLADNAIARMVTEMQRRRLTMLSCWPRLELVTFAEKALMPLLNTVVFSIFPGVLSLFRGEPSLGLAHGACLMFDRPMYEALGGHSAVRDQIFEDTRLAQLWRQRGERSLGLDGQDIVSVRMYDSFGAIWAGFQKNFFPAFQAELSFWVFMLLHATVYLAPFYLALSGQRGYVIAALAVLLMRLLLAWRFQQPLWSALLQPFTEVVLLALGLSSWWCCKSGRGVTWKGRAYHKVQARV